MVWAAVVAGVVQLATQEQKKQAEEEKRAAMGAFNAGSDFINDNSGWNINFANGNIDDRDQKTITTGPKTAMENQPPDFPTSAITGYQPQGMNQDDLLLIAGAGVLLLVVGVVAMRKKKRAA